MRGGKAIIGSIYNIPLKPPGGVGSPGRPGSPDNGSGDDDKDNGDDDKSPPKDGIGDDGGMKGNCSFYDANAPHALSGSQPIATENDECSLITGEGPSGTYGEGSGNKGMLYIDPIIAFPPLIYIIYIFKNIYNIFSGYVFFLA